MLFPVVSGFTALDFHTFGQMIQLLKYSHFVCKMQTNQPAGQSHLNAYVNYYTKYQSFGIYVYQQYTTNNGDAIKIFTTKLDESDDGFGNGCNQFFSHCFTQCQHCAILHGIDQMNVNYNDRNNYNLNMR